MLANQPDIRQRVKAARRPVNSNARVQDRSAHDQWRHERRDDVRNYAQQHLDSQFWAQHPNWARLRITAPYRWATWAAVAAWFPWQWSEPQAIYYGDTVYYEANQVYYDDQSVATAEEYAEQAKQLATGAETPDHDAQWMPLGIFAVVSDDESSKDDPTIYVQLAVNRKGIIAGTRYDVQSDKTVAITGKVDEDSQRAAWVVEGTTWPVMEVAIANLTTDKASALLHHSAKRTERMLLIRLAEPERGSQSDLTAP